MEIVMLSEIGDSGGVEYGPMPYKTVMVAEKDIITFAGKLNSFITTENANKNKMKKFWFKGKQYNLWVPYNFILEVEEWTEEEYEMFKEEEMFI